MGKSTAFFESPPTSEKQQHDESHELLTEVSAHFFIQTSEKDRNLFQNLTYQSDFPTS